MLSITNAKARFVANSDLAQTAVRETQVLAAKSIVEGLKPELSMLPKLASNIEVLNGKLNALGDLPERVKALEGLPAMVKALENIPTMMSALDGLPGLVTGLKSVLDESVERTVEANDARASDSEEILCFHKRLQKLFTQFGFSSKSTGIDVPHSVSLILGQTKGHSSATEALPIVTNICDCGRSWDSLDTSKPPPSVAAASGSTSVSMPVRTAPTVGARSGQESVKEVSQNDFLMDKRNNNVPAGQLIYPPPHSFSATSATPDGMNYLPGQAPHLQQQAHGHQVKRSYPFQEPQNSMKK